MVGFYPPFVYLGNKHVFMINMVITCICHSFWEHSMDIFSVGLFLVQSGGSLIFSPALLGVGSWL